MKYERIFENWRDTKNKLLLNEDEAEDMRDTARTAKQAVQGASDLLSIFNKDYKALKSAVEKKDSESIITLGGRVFDNAAILVQNQQISTDAAMAAQTLGLVGLAMQTKTIYENEGIAPAVANALSDGLYSKWTSNIANIRKNGLGVVNSTQLLKNVYDTGKWAVKQVERFTPAAEAGAEGGASGGISAGASALFYELILPVGVVMLSSYMMTDYLIKTGNALKRGATAAFLNKRDIVVQRGAGCENIRFDRCPPQNIKQGIAGGKRQFKMTSNWEQRELVGMFVQQERLNPQRDATEDYPYAFALVDDNYKELVKPKAREAQTNHGFEASAVGMAQAGQAAAARKKQAGNFNYDAVKNAAAAGSKTQVLDINGNPAPAETIGVTYLWSDGTRRNAPQPKRNT